jgi:hypothetical protein
LQREISTCMRIVHTSPMIRRRCQIFKWSSQVTRPGPGTVASESYISGWRIHNNSEPPTLWASTFKPLRLPSQGWAYRSDSEWLDDDPARHYKRLGGPGCHAKSAPYSDSLKTLESSGSGKTRLPLLHQRAWEAGTGHFKFPNSCGYLLFESFKPKKQNQEWLQKVTRNSIVLTIYLGPIQTYHRQGKLFFSLVTGAQHWFLVVFFGNSSMLRDTARKLLLFYIVVNVITNPVDLAAGKSSQFSEILVLYYSAPTEFAVISDFMT